MCETAVEYAPDYQSFWTVSRKDISHVVDVCYGHNSLGRLNYWQTA